jgi:hypothetical protein
MTIVQRRTVDSERVISSISTDRKVMEYCASLYDIHCSWRRKELTG